MNSEREQPVQGTLTIDITLAALLVLMMARTVARLLRWYRLAIAYEPIMTDQEVDSFFDHLVYLITYFCFLWVLLDKTVSLTFF